MKNAAKLTKEVKYVPLPGCLHRQPRARGQEDRHRVRWQNEVGITIEDLMKREAKM
jgi:phosphate transport system substrate-binding protein